MTLSFATGAAVLSGALAGATYGLAHHLLLAQRLSSAVNQTFTNARLVEQDLTAPATDVAAVLSSLTPAQGTRSVLYRGGNWFSTSVAVGHTALPRALVDDVLRGSPERQRISFGGAPAVAVGVPLPAVGADYFEVHPLTELARTLDVLAIVLGVGAVATTLGGVAVGRWASGRLVRPLSEVADVAAAIRRGQVGQRLPTARDADLDPLVASFNDMVDALQSRIERDARFASDVSHELRSPLTTVQTSIELLELFSASLPADGQRALELLSIEIGRFSAMVQDLLEISRMDAGAVSLDLEEVHLDELVVNTVAAHTRGSVPVRVDPDAVDITVQGDRRRLQRVIANLLDNARIHGGGAVLVTVGSQDRRAHIIVDDAGPGVAPDERARIFDRFYRGSASGRRSDGSGSGLGLSLTAEHVKAHRGEITVGVRPGGGARFRVELPANRR